MCSLLIWVHAEAGLQNSTVTYLLGWLWGLPRCVWGLETCISLKHLAALFQFLEREHLFIVMADDILPYLPVIIALFNVMPFGPVGSNRKASFNVDVIICSASFVPLSSSLLYFLNFLLLMFFSSLYVCFPSAQPSVSFLVSTENVSGLLSQVSDKHEEGCWVCFIIFNSALKGNTCLTMTPATSSAWGWRVCMCVYVPWKSRSAERTQSYSIYLGGGRVWMAEMGEFYLNLEVFSISVLITNFLFSSFQKLQSFPAWKQEPICERQE